MPGTPAGPGTAAGHSTPSDPAPRAAPGPSVERLAGRLAQATPEAREAVVEAFWADVERRGTPLVEPLDDDPGHHAVTFLRRGHRATRQVLLLVNRVVDRDHLAGSLMRPLPGTDVWHLTYRMRDDHRASYKIVADLSPGELPSDDAVMQERLRSLCAFAGPDPLNPHPLPTRWHGTDSSVFALPDAAPQPWAERRAAVPRGTVERHSLPSTALEAERDVWVYLPPSGATGTDNSDGTDGTDTDTDTDTDRELPVVVLCDGDMWFGQLGLQDTLDALIADGAVPPLAVLAPDAVNNATRWRDLGGRDPYAHFLGDELLPWASAHWPLTADPARTVVAGQSLGGLTALYAALVRPARFGNVLAQSPSLWWRPGLAPGVPREAVESPQPTPWLVASYAESEVPPVTIHLDVGLHEGSMAGHCRALHDTLSARGHRVTRNEYNGGHDYACWRGYLADGLVRLLGRPEA